MKAGRWLSAGFLMMATLTVFASDVKIIANGSVQADTISAAELKRVFLLERKTLRDGSRVAPVLRRSGGTHESFLRLYLDRGSEELQTYYQGLVFTGKESMPKQLNSDAEVVAYVARTRGSIGYVSSATSSDGVKVLNVIAGDAKGKRALLTRVEPEYPDALRERGICGTVRLELTISAKGSVETVAVLGGNPILAEAATKAVKQWVYSPASARTTAQVSIPFEAHP